MHSRHLAVAFSVLVVLGALPFAITPDTETGSVPFEQTKQTGLPDNVVREAESSDLVIPKAEVYYSQYRYVMGYYGVTSLVAALRTQEPEAFGSPTRIYVSDYAGIDLSLTDDGHLRAPPTAPTKWVRADEAYFVVGSNATIPTRDAAIVPFSTRTDAASFADRYGGEVRRWDATQRASTGRLGRSSADWREVVDQRRDRANATVARAEALRDRPVSVVVGRDAATVADAVEQAPPNTTVRVPSGTHRVDDLRVEKPLTIRGSGANETRLVGDGNGSVITAEAPRTAVADLAITGVGDNRSGRDRSVDVPVNESAWNYDIWKVHGYGDAAVVFDTAGGSLVSSVRMNTTSNGVVSRNSPGTAVTNLSLYGTKRWEDGFIGVVTLGGRAVVQDSEFYGGKVGVYAHESDGAVVRNASMEGMMVGVFDFYGIRTTVLDSSVEDTWNAVYVEHRSYGAVVAGNDLRNSRNGVLVTGQANYVADNVAVHNRNGISVHGQFSTYERNVLANNVRGVRVLSFYPTNTVTENDVLANERPAEIAGFNIQHVWRGNYWEGAPGIDGDGDGRLSRSYRATGAVDGRIGSVDGTPTLARSPAVTFLRELQQVLPGLRSGDIVDARPRASPTRPETVRWVESTYDGVGRHSDDDPWDFRM
ncbi:copper-binding protein [Halostella sp. JP-L12]|uniref:nitrous oxide reductase accessory protein NosL n=1 Tax=Halostella TaxID=1843185 RepID=UPI000EF84D41|nr:MULTISPECIES: nitrous oxide reductase accessory protein NosL [Halostella]NHN49384.1 copper-binding protein [Halostella sp. JP-L12]